MRLLIALGALLLGTALPSQAAAQRGIPVNIESVPPGATVYLDTADGAPLGITPMQAVRIQRGAHTLIFRMPNFEEARLSITVQRRRETFRAVLRALGTIEVSAGNDGARGAEVRIDGQPVGGGTLGSLPIRMESLPPGRHQVEVSREGYNTFQQWVDVQGGQVVRITAMLERSAPTVGSILVTADIQGAPIFLDGRQVGTTTTVLDDVPAGTHTLEIRPEGEDVQPFSQQVLVAAGQRATVSATLRRPSTAPTTGSIAIITDVTDARVRINGQELPAGTFSREGLAPGNYVIQVIAEGHLPFRREVQVTAGQTTSVDVQLERQRGAPTRINIQVANVTGARVTVDGEERTAPFVVNQPEAGTHAVVIRASGYADISFTCSTQPEAPAGDSCDRTITMEPLAVSIRVGLSHQIEGEATLAIDGRAIGPVPYEGRIEVGDHIIEVTAEGYEPYRQQMLVNYEDGAITIEANMRDSTEEAAARAVTHSALPIVVNHPMIDLSGGWPYLAEVRLSIGLHELFDAGFGVRTFGRITEFEARARFGGRVIRQLAFGVQVRGGGGIGPNIGLRDPIWTGIDGDPIMPGVQEPMDGRQQDFDPGVNNMIPGLTVPVNNAFFSVEGITSLLLEPIAAVSLWLGVDITSDEYAAHPRSPDAWIEREPSHSTRDVCMPGMMGDLRCSPNRQDMARLRLGGSVEFVLTPNWNLWVIFEGILFAPPDRRRILSGFLTNDLDIQIYPRLGTTFKF